MSDATRAWLLDIGAGWRVAAGVPHVVEYLLAPEPTAVPRAPAHCAGLLVWRERLIPVIDLAPMLAGPAPARGSTTRRAVILAWQERPREPLAYGALLVNAAPVETWVSDDMAGVLPDSPAVFRHIARACFIREDRTIPILDARQLFGRALPPTLSAFGADVRVVDSAMVQPASVVSDDRAPVPGPAPAAGVWTVAAADIDLPFRSPPASVLAGADAPAADTGPTMAGHERMDGWPADFAFDAPPADPPSVPDVTPDWLEPVAAEVAGPAWGEPEPAPPVADAASSPAPNRHVRRPAISTTVQSYQRLRALERRGRAPDRHRLRWGLIAAGVALAAIAAALLAPSEVVVVEPPAATASAPRDINPGGMIPASIPSAPAQPPN